MACCITAVALATLGSIKARLPMPMHMDMPMHAHALAYLRTSQSPTHLPTYALLTMYAGALYRPQLPTLRVTLTLTLTLTLTRRALPTTATYAPGRRQSCSAARVPPSLSLLVARSPPSWKRPRLPTAWAWTPLTAHCGSSPHRLLGAQ